MTRLVISIGLFALLIYGVYCVLDFTATGVVSTVETVSGSIDDFLGAEDATPGEYIRADVVRVVDGQTVEVTAKKGKKQLTAILRTAGVALPDGEDEKQAGEYLESLIHEGDTVFFEIRGVDGDCILAYIWTKKIRNPGKNALLKYCINARMLQAGMARPTYEGLYVEEFREIYEDAKKEGTGIFNESN